jgi:hypothetical protein
LFFSITQHPYFWVSSKQGAVHGEGNVDLATVNRLLGFVVILVLDVALDQASLTN